MSSCSLQPFVLGFYLLTVLFVRISSDLNWGHRDMMVWSRTGALLRHHAWLWEAMNGCAVASLWSVIVRRLAALCSRLLVQFYCSSHLHARLCNNMPVGNCFYLSYKSRKLFTRSQFLPICIPLFWCYPLSPVMFGIDRSAPCICVILSWVTAVFQAVIIRRTCTPQVRVNTLVRVCTCVHSCEWGNTDCLTYLRYRRNNGMIELFFS